MNFNKKVNAFMGAIKGSIKGNVSINGQSYKVNNITVKNGVVTVDGEVVESSAGELVVNGNIKSLETDRSVRCDGDIGELNAGGSVTCEDVHGNIASGGSVNCEKVNGNIQAGVVLIVDKIDLSNDIVFVGFEATAYHSGKHSVVGIVCYEEDLEEVKESSEILKDKSYYFHGLDGKHSCVDGNYIEIKGFEECVRTYMDVDEGIYALGLHDLDEKLYDEILDLNILFGKITTTKKYVVPGSIIKDFEDEEYLISEF